MMIRFLKFLLFIIFTFLAFANADNIPATAIQINQPNLESIQIELAKLESLYGGRLGIFALNTANNKTIQYRANERFAFCSTGKIMVVGAVLKKSEKNPDLLQKNITYTQKDIDKSTYAPITKQYLKDGMSVYSLCEATLDYSDNTAMNLLTNMMGGVSAIATYAKTINDNKFRLDRFEPELNSAIPGDVRDTTTPMAMGKSLQQLVLGNILDIKQRKILTSWLKNNTTGNSRIRAGVPNGWIVGDKTGTGDYGTTNDIGIIWPPKCAPIVIAIYYTQNKKDAKPKESVIASATHLLINDFAMNDKCIK